MTDKQYEYISMKGSLKLATYRKLAGMSQEELAEQSGVSLSTIGKLELINICSSPGIKTLFALAEVLGVVCERARDKKQKSISILLDFICEYAVTEKSRYLVGECFELYLPVFLLVHYMRAKYVEKLNVQCKTDSAKELLAKLYQAEWTLKEQAQMAVSAKEYVNSP